MHSFPVYSVDLEGNRPDRCGVREGTVRRQNTVMRRSDTHEVLYLHIQELASDIGGGETRIWLLPGYVPAPQANS